MSCLMINILSFIHFDLHGFIVCSHFKFFFKELQALQREKESICKEKEDISACLLEQEKAKQGRF